MPLDFDTLTFHEVTRNFGRRRALNRVSLTCHAGRIVALLGANGAGKSTLLAIAAAMLDPSAGDVRYGSYTARNGGAALRGRIGLLGHDLFVYPELSAAENLLFFGRLYQIPALEPTVEQALGQAGLAHRSNDPVGAFSRGMRQRLAIERTLLHRPRLVLFDEPFTGLDDEAVRVLQDRLRQLREDGCIVLITTHELEAVEALADRSVVLLGGRLVDLPEGPGTLRDRFRRVTSAS